MNPIGPMIEAGVDTGLIRAFRSLPGFTVDNLDALRTELRGRVIPIISGYSPDRAWGPRGQATYSELFAMGSAARMHYKEASTISAAANEILGPLTRFSTAGCTNSQESAVSEPVDTVAARLAKYQGRLRLRTAVAAALIAEVTTFSAVKFSEGEDHSDRGSQYASTEYQVALAHPWDTGSMRASTGKCGDSAVAESFFATLKVELAHDTPLAHARRGAQGPLQTASGSSTSAPAAFVARLPQPAGV